jgi:predicted  nucleic acid-binding Zn-ribbon protein
MNEDSMNEDSLQKQLRRLQGELQRAPIRERATREQLRELAEEIDRALEGGERSGLTERLQGSVALFEAEHPDLALLTARVIDQLVKLGV